MSKGEQVDSMNEQAERITENHTRWIAENVYNLELYIR